jgi:hypothetical protein
MLRFSAKSLWSAVRWRQAPFVLGLLMLAISALTACSLGSVVGGSEYTPGAQSLLQDARKAMDTNTAFYFTLKVDHAGAPRAGTVALLAATGDARRPNQAKGNAAVSMGGPEEVVYFISIGDQQWVQAPLSPQWVLAGQAGINLSHLFDPATGMGAMLNALQKTGANNGQDTVAGDGDCWIVEGTLPPSAVAAVVGVTPSGSAPVDTTVCVAKTLDEQGLRQLYELIVKGVVAVGDTAQTTRTVMFSKFNETITIEPPQP